jgi:hypothetical protein
MYTKISVLIFSIFLVGCESAVLTTHKEAMNRLEYHYIVHYAHVPGSKKCLNPKKIRNQWFVLCGINLNRTESDVYSAGIWEIKEEENGGWAVYAYDKNAAKSQKLFIDDPQIRPPLQVPSSASANLARKLFIAD